MAAFYGGDGSAIPFNRAYPVDEDGRSEIFYFTTYNPEDITQPNPLLGSVKLAVECTDSALQFNRNSSANGMSAGAIVSIKRRDNEARPTDEDIKAFKSAFKKMITSPKNAGRVVLMMNNEAAVTELGNNARDMQFTEMLNFVARAINNIYGVPAQLIGVTTEANSYANYNQAIRAYYEGQGFPSCREHFSDELSRYL